MLTLSKKIEKLIQAQTLPVVLEEISQYCQQVADADISDAPDTAIEQDFRQYWLTAASGVERVKETLEVLNGKSFG